MASAQALAATPFLASSEGSNFPVSSSSFAPISIRLENGMRKSRHLRRRGSGRLRLRFSGGGIRAMVQEAVQQGPSAVYAREMERLSAKESLLLALKDAGGFDALVSGRTNDMQRIDVTERITSLERLNPTPRPTTSPYLEGKWNLEWFGATSPGLSAAGFIFERIPMTMAKLSRPDIWIKDGYTKLTANMKLLNSVQLRFVLTSKLSVEGQLRMKEQLSEGLIESPVIIEESVPEQLKSLLGQAINTVQQLPAPISDAVSNGFKLSLSGTNFERVFMISYLDDEILIIRDTIGKPEVLTRLDSVPASGPEPVNEYES